MVMSQMTAWATAQSEGTKFKKTPFFEEYNYVAYEYSVSLLQLLTYKHILLMYKIDIGLSVSSL